MRLAVADLGDGVDGGELGEGGAAAEEGEEEEGGLHGDGRVVVVDKEFVVAGLFLDMFGTEAFGSCYV